MAVRSERHDVYKNKLCDKQNCSSDDNSSGDFSHLENVCDWTGKVSSNKDLFHIEANVTNDNGEHNGTGEQNKGDGDQRVHKSTNSGGKIKGMITRSRRKPIKHKSAKSSKQNQTDASGVANEQELFDVEIEISANRKNLGRRASPFEVLFGIIVDKEDGENRIIVRGLLPFGEAIKVETIRLGDCIRRVDGLDVNLTNANNILANTSNSKKVCLTMHRFEVPKPVNANQNNAQNNCDFVRILSGDTSPWDEYTLSMYQMQFVALYLTTHNITEESKAKDDILYQFPLVENRMVLIKGAFSTVKHLLPDVIGCVPQRCCLSVEGEFVNVEFVPVGEEELLLIALPSNCVSAEGLSQITQDITRLLWFLCEDLHSAFTDPQHKSTVDRIFALTFTSVLKPTNTNGGRKPPLVDLERVFSIESLPKWLPLSTDLRVEVGDVLSEFESGDYGELNDSYFETRLQFDILGSAIYYKDYLVVSHLPVEDLLDINLYLRYHWLLKTTREHSLTELVVWKQVFKPGARPDDLQWFLLIVGKGHFLVPVILETGNCAAYLNDDCLGPDLQYVEYAKDVLYRLHSLGLTSAIQRSFKTGLGPSLAKLTTVDTAKSANDELALKKEAIANKADSIISKSAKLLTPKRKSDAAIWTAMSAVDLSDAGSLTKDHSPGTSSWNSDETTAFMRRMASLSDRGDSCSSSRCSVGTSRSITNPSFTGGYSDECSSKAGSDTALYKAPSRSRRAFTKPENDQSRSANRSTTCRLTSGLENTLLCYAFVDSRLGTTVCPVLNESFVFDNTSIELFKVFKEKCAQMKLVFDLEPPSNPASGQRDNLSEQAVMVNTIPKEMSSLHRKKASAPNYSFWIVGRRLDVHRQAYICYHASAQQDAVEMAFRLAFNSFL